MTTQIVDAKQAALLIIGSLLVGFLTGMTPFSMGSVNSNNIYNISLIIPLLLLCIAITFLAPHITKGLKNINNKIQAISKSAKTISTICLILILIPLPIIGTNTINEINADIGNQIINAINKFEKENGYYPNNLDQITPKYLRIIPNSMLGKKYEDEKIDLKIFNTNKQTNCNNLIITKFRIKTKGIISGYTYLYDSNDNKWYLEPKN